MFHYDPNRPNFVGTYDALGALFPPCPPDPATTPPVDFYMFAMLSARTPHLDAVAAYTTLLLMCYDWYEVLLTPAKRIAQAIERSTWPDKKAESLKSALGALHYRRNGRLNLDNLFNMSDVQASLWLEQQPYTGRKTAWCVLLFSSLRRAVLPVDTGLRRFAIRYGVLSRSTGWDEAHYVLLRQLPSDWDADQIEIFHNTLKRFIQTYCKAEPACPVCPLRDTCVFGRNHAAGGSAMAIERRKRHSSFQESPWQLEFD